MTTEDLIRQRFKEAEGLNFAACRFPDTNETWFFYSGKSPVLKRLSYVAERTPDFVFSPYSGGNQAYFLNAEAVFKNETQRIAFISAIAFGVIISALGVRAIELFVDPDVFQELSEQQSDLFHIVDVLITGALLGGGADVWHKIISVLTTFMDRTTKRMKDETNRA